MTKLLALFVLTAASVFAQAETIDLRSRGKLTLYLPETWSVDVANYGERHIVTIAPKSEEVNASCTMTITFPERDELSTKAKLKAALEEGLRPIAEGSVEGRAVAKELTLHSGMGFHCNFTDPELIGKKPQKGNYKNMTAALIRIAPDVVAEVSIVADGFTSQPYQELLGAIEGMEYARKG